MNKLWKRISDRDRLAHCMVIAFGLSLLMITLQFQFGRTTIVMDDPPAIIKLEQGYITERNQAVKIIEGLASLGLITLGIERLINAKRRARNSQSNRT